MNRRQPTAVLAAALSFGLVALAGIGCAHEQQRAPSHCAATHFPTPYAETDPCSPDAVLTAAATAIFTYRPDRQRDTATAFLAAAPLITPDYMHQIGASATALAPITAATWARWSSLHITVTATARITEDDHPTDISNRIRRVIAVTQHPGDEPGRELTAYLQVARDSADKPWLVTDLEVR